MADCKLFDPDNVFRRLNLVEFPMSFVNLFVIKYIDVKTSLEKSGYLKTSCDGSLMTFNDAREVSASHRAYTVTQVSDHVIEVTFKPTADCTSPLKTTKLIDGNTFMFDLRLIQVDGLRCCNSEYHSEISRYYFSGKYEYCNISHYPDIIDFGDTNLNDKKIMHVKIYNNAEFIAARIEYVLTPGYELIPNNCIIPPNRFKKFSITVKPNSFKMGNHIVIRIRNPHDSCIPDDIDEELKPQTKEMAKNYLTYSIGVKVKVICKSVARKIEIQSLHTITEPDIRYTHIEIEELNLYKQRKQIALKQLQFSKSMHPNKKSNNKYINFDSCCDKTLHILNKKHFCEFPKQKINTYGIVDILVLPFYVDFHEVGQFTFGDYPLTFQNNSKYDITIQLQEHELILYTNDKVKTFTLTLKPHREDKLTIHCYGYIKGKYQGAFQYSINNMFIRQHPFTLEVVSPMLEVLDKSLKFGMTSTESFVTSVPVRIYNDFNISVEYNWEELYPDFPFEIIPSSGIIPKHSCRICDIICIANTTKTKTHEVNFISMDASRKVIPIELSIVSKKIVLKFLPEAVQFIDIPLNMQVEQKVKLENISKEIVTFYILEPLIPGLTIEPMCGTIKPKVVMIFNITVKIACLLDFSFPINFKINHKENILLPVSGNVIEPKVTVHPKNIYMGRVPCYMVAYVPLTFQNGSPFKTLIEILDTGDENIFDIYNAVGNEKIRIFDFFLDENQSKTVFIKVYDTFRREYDMFIPFRINGLLGPPDKNRCTSKFHYYTAQFEKLYENNPKVKMRSINKDISHCRMSGVIIVQAIKFSREDFEINYSLHDDNNIKFSITNISRNKLTITIITTKIAPVFSLDLESEYSESIINENNIRFKLAPEGIANLSLQFHPKMHGRFVATAPLFLDEQMSIPYHNLTFIGRRQVEAMIPSTHCLILPPCPLGTVFIRTITVKIGIETNIDAFSSTSKEETNVTTKFISAEVVEELGNIHTILTVKLKVCSESSYNRDFEIFINHESGSGCQISISFCFTSCPLTLHSSSFTTLETNPYPFYPLKTDTELYQYMETCTDFLEKWMFQQGFRRDLNPMIPDTFHAISSGLCSQQSAMKTKTTNVTFLNYVKRIAGPLVKYLHRVSVDSGHESFKRVHEIHDTYKQIVHLLQARGSCLWGLKPIFLLTYEQFVIFVDNTIPKSQSDAIITAELRENVTLFERLAKQSWIDIILQSYKAFVVDSCFFECICETSGERDIVKVLIEWYNANIKAQHKNLRKGNEPVKEVTNLTTDMSDGIAIISAILGFCPFMKKHFSLFSEVGDDPTAAIINNACLIIESINILKLYFPLSSKELLQPNFIQMLFLSIHLYILLPMLTPREIIKFSPPLLQSSSRQLSICSVNQETLIFTCTILKDPSKKCGDSFIVEKAPATDTGKKMYLSIKYKANFVAEENSVLLIHGFNKSRIFDTYTVFFLKGCAGALIPIRKYRVTGPLYRPVKVDILLSSPFSMDAHFDIHITDTEPTLPDVFESITKPRFYLRRLNLVDKELTLTVTPSEAGGNTLEHKISMYLVCLSTRIGNSWMWFRSEIGEFFVKVLTHPRCELPVEVLPARVMSWPLDPCSCGDECKCYRTTTVTIPHNNDMMVKSLRFALLEHSSAVMMNVFESLIDSSTGLIILNMLLLEGGTMMSEINHILSRTITYNITSNTLIPHLQSVTLSPHSAKMLTLPITLPADTEAHKFTLTLTSECGMDVRTYNILVSLPEEKPSFLPNNE